MPQVTVSLELDIDPKKLYTQRLLLVYLDYYLRAGTPRSVIGDIIAGMIEVTDVIADKLADTGYPQALLTDTKKEDKLGTQLTTDLMCGILKGYTHNK